MPRMITCLAAVAAGATLVTACSGSASPGAPTVVRTVTHVPSRPIAPATGAIVAGPTTSAQGTCPFLDEPTAADTVGVRMGRVVVLSSGGSAVGCDFFADQDPAYKASEHLPGPDQPVLRITTSRFHDATSAHNAMVRIAVAGSNARPAGLSSNLEGISFQTAFYPADNGHDWAFVLRTGNTVVTVTTVQTDTAYDARAVGAAIAGKF